MGPSRAVQPLRDAAARLFETAPWWHVLGVVVVLALAWILREPLLLFFGAVLVAATLRALAGPLIRTGVVGPRVAVVAVTVSLAALVALGLWLLGEPLAEQLQGLREALPQAWQALRTWLQRAPIGDRILSEIAQLRQSDLPLAGIAGFASQAVQVVGAAVVMVLIGVYLAADVRLYRDGLVRLMPVPARARIGAALDASGQALSCWLLGQAITMVVIGAAVAIGLSLLDMPLALALGVIAGLLEFVPFFGPIGSGLLAVLVAFVQGPTQAFYVALLFIGLQQIEGNLIVPLVQRWAVRLPPVLGLVAVVVFGVIFGPLGVLLGTPLMVVLMVLVKKLYVEALLERSPP